MLSASTAKASRRTGSSAPSRSSPRSRTREPAGAAAAGGADQRHGALLEGVRGAGRGSEEKERCTSMRRSTNRRPPPHTRGYRMEETTRDGLRRGLGLGLGRGLRVPACMDMRSLWVSSLLCAHISRQEPVARIYVRESVTVSCRCRGRAGRCLGCDIKIQKAKSKNPQPQSINRRNEHRW